MHKVLFCPPDFFQIVDVKNPFMEGAAAVDKAKARAQWESVRKAFADAGFGLLEIPAVAGLEDMVFAANQTFVGVTSDGRRFIVPSLMRFDSRRLEVPHFVEFFRQNGFEIFDLGLDLAAGEFLEGHGDLLWNADHGFVWAGHGFRSSSAGVKKFAAKMRALDIPVVDLELRDPRFYHLDTCLAPLTADAVLIYPGAFTPAALETIRGKIARIYEVPEQEALDFVCNGVAANGTFIAAKMTPGLQRALDAEGLRPRLVDTSEFEKSGGSVYCLKAFLP
jgi:N-dimethylarginine dimethylaminohydrolase